MGAMIMVVKKPTEAKPVGKEQDKTAPLARKIAELEARINKLEPIIESMRNVFEDFMLVLTDEQYADIFEEEKE